jgi:hypothetical protein
MTKKDKPVTPPVLTDNPHAPDFLLMHVPGFSLPKGPFD